MSEPIYTDLEKQIAFKKYQINQKKMFTRGKIIVFTVATINAVASIINFSSSFNIIILLLEIGLSIALFRGISWVKYLFAIASALNAIRILFFLMGGVADFSDINSKIVVFFVISGMVIYLCYCIAASIMLFASKSVSSFLYSRKNG